MVWEGFWTGVGNAMAFAGGIEFVNTTRDGVGAGLVSAFWPKLKVANAAMTYKAIPGLFFIEFFGKGYRMCLEQEATTGQHV